jgi:Zn-dependent protease
VSGGYLQVGRWNGAPVRLHWTLPLGALVLGQGRFAPGFWLGFVLIVLIHEVGHALVVRRQRHRVVSIDVHALGGVCRWAGDATPIQRARVAWGGVEAQMVALVVAVVATRVLGAPRTSFARDLAEAFIYPNLWLIALNLIPVPPLDGAEAWKLPGLLRARAAAQRARARGGARQSAARELARLDARDDDVPADTAAAVDARLRELAEGSGKKRG